MTFGPEAHAWLARSIGPASRFDLVPLKGATSSSVFVVQAARGRQPQRFVLRVLDNLTWLADEPDLAAHEAAALTEAHRAGLKAPRLIAHSADDVGFGAPVVLMSFVDGSVELQPGDFAGWLDGLARELALIHRHPARSLAWRFESWVNKTTLAPPTWTSIPGAWERAIQRVRADEPAARLVFIHRDFHPTNVLWHAGVVSGIVDWINACRGPAGVDVAHCRSNLAQMYGPVAADKFLAAYREVADGFAYNPYWDLDSLLDTCLPELSVYPPWREFGLEGLTTELLQQRVDAYLETVLLRL